jgi:hypothetical protein
MDIEQRIERLERHNRLLRIGLVGLVVVVIGCQVSGERVQVRHANAQQASAPRVVEAEEFRLLDRTGKLRASLDMTLNDPRLRLFRENGLVLVCLAGSELGSGLVFFDEKGHQRASLTAPASPPTGTALDASGLTLWDENRPRVGLTLDNNGTSLMFVGERGYPRAWLASPTGKATELSFSDEGGKETWAAP